MDGLTILFCGATGRLAALTPLLLDRGHRVLAATREPGSARARQLRERGAQVVRVDFDEVASLTAGAGQADTVVAAGTAHAAGAVNDLRHGRNIVDAARAAGVGQLIYLTVAGADRATGVPIMDSKYALERYLRDSGVPHTIISPVYFMENLWNPWNAPALATGRLPSPISRFKPLQQVPIEDVLTFTAHVVESRDATLGERIEIASDEISAHQAAEIVSRLLGRPIAVADPPADVTNPLFEWLERVGTHVDIAALRRHYPELRWHTFAEWTTTEDWSPLRANNIRATPSDSNRSAH
jgi:uncharacterized protein YbjT (DUF2867 family)